MDTPAPTGPAALVAANGPPPVPGGATAKRLRARLDAESYQVVIGVDGGTQALRTLGITPTLVVGDNDSIDPDTTRWVLDGGARLDEHDRDKDHSDLELALGHARSAGCTAVDVIGALGGRWDHSLVNVGVCGAPEWHPMRLRILDDAATIEITVPGRPVAVDVGAGSTVTLLATGGPAAGVTTSGMQWELDDATLHPASSHGLSNVTVGHTASVEIESGTLLVIIPR